MAVANHLQQPFLYYLTRSSFYCLFNGLITNFRTIVVHFLVFREDFLYGHELPHDILCRRAAHDNRRAAGAVDFFSMQNSIY